MRDFLRASVNKFGKENIYERSKVRVYVRGVTGLTN